MQTVLSFIARVVFIIATLVFFLSLLLAGSVVALVWWLWAKLSGRGQPPVRVWAQRFEQRARAAARQGGAGGVGEVVDAEVREVKEPR